MKSVLMLNLILKGQNIVLYDHNFYYSMLHEFPILSCFWYRWWLPGTQYLLTIHVTHGCQVHKDALFLKQGGGIDWSWNSVLLPTKLITCNFLWQATSCQGY